MNIFDISQELTKCKVYTGDITPQLNCVKTIQNDGYNLTEILFCAHNGTHIDAPRHFLDDGKAVDELPLSYFVGKAQVITLEGDVDEKIVNNIKISAKRLLVKGGGALTEGGANALAKSGVILIGTESQSVGDYDKPKAVHLALFKNKIIPLEGLNLNGVTDGNYYLFAQPINVCGCDGAPVRAILVDKFDE